MLYEVERFDLQAQQAQHLSENQVSEEPDFNLISVFRDLKL